MRKRRPSATAHVIACSTVFLSHEPRYTHLIPALTVEASAWFMRAYSPVSWRLIGLMKQHWFRTAVAALERAMVPGIMLHYLLRKRWIEDCVRACLAEGVDQIIIMGAGFDTLALRLHREFPHVRFFEIDHSDTQQVKRRASESQRMLAANIRFIAADLTQESWERAIWSHSDFRDQASTLVIAEAVLMYLQPNDLNIIFKFLREHTDQHSRFLFSFMEPTDDGKVSFRNATRLLDPWLWWRGEPFTWGVRREALSSYLRDRGFSLQQLAIPLPEGEYVCLAERSNSATSSMRFPSPSA
jgi:methyltransferase (TIGR00027 family)